MNTLAIRKITLKGITNHTSVISMTPAAKIGVIEISSPSVRK